MFRVPRVEGKGEGEVCRPAERPDLRDVVREVGVWGAGDTVAVPLNYFKLARQGIAGKTTQLKN